MNMYHHARSMKSELIDIRRHLHQNPEIGMNLPYTVEYITKQLIGMGYQPVLMGGGIVVSVGKGEKTFLLRADMDALPIKEESEVDFASYNGCMHACGHDMHIAMLLGAARLLKEREIDLKGNVLLVFQPGEEVLQGAKSMIASGLYEKQKPQAAMAVHISSFASVGQVCFNKQGSMMAACQEFRIEIKGKSTHNSMPGVGVDAIEIGVEIYQELKNLVKETAVNHTDCSLTIGQFHGGNFCNVLSEHTVLEGTVRSLSTQTGKELMTRIQKLTQSIAASLGGQAQVQILASVPSLECDPSLTTELVEWVKQLPVRGLQVMGGLSTKASEDFAVIAQDIPSTYLILGAKAVEGNPFPNHNPMVVFNEDVLPLGTAILATCAIKWLEKQTTS